MGLRRFRLRRHHLRLPEAVENLFEAREVGLIVAAHLQLGRGNRDGEDNVAAAACDLRGVLEEAVELTAEAALSAPADEFLPSRTSSR
jgi:hypothetical protein